MTTLENKDHQSPEADRKPGYLWSLAHQKCARCRQGNMFKHSNAYNLKHFMKMNDNCPACDQRMEIEVGFYYGTSYVSYVLTVALSVTSFVAWWVLIGLSVHDNRFFLVAWHQYHVAAPASALPDAFIESYLAVVFCAL